MHRDIERLAWAFVLAAAIGAAIGFYMAWENMNRACVGAQMEQYE